MRTALDVSEANFDVTEKQFVANVREHGWFRTSVAADEHGPSFSYTTGFWQGVQKPELIISGLNHETAHQILWDIYTDAKAGKSLPIGVPVAEVFGNHAAYIFPVAKRFYSEYLGWSLWFYCGDNFDCLQIVWPDREGIFPWQDGYDPSFADDQPDLTENGWLAALKQ